MPSATWNADAPSGMLVRKNQKRHNLTLFDTKQNARSILMTTLKSIERSPRIKKASLRYYRKRVELFRLIDKIKLWPSRRGLLHGIKTMDILGNQARITTHCNKTFTVNNSRNSRAARWLRNKWFHGVCRDCNVPEWKLEKYSSTRFKRHFGSTLSRPEKMD